MADWRDSIPQASQAAQPASSWKDSIPQAGASSGGHAPDWTDDVKASANMAKSVGSGLVSSVTGLAKLPGAIADAYRANPINPLGELGVNMGKGMVQQAGNMWNQLQTGDLDHLGNNLGNVAGQVLLSKVLPKVPEGAESAAQTVSRVAQNAPAVGKAVAGVGKAAVPVAGATAATVLSHGWSAGLLFKAAANLVKGGSLGDVVDSITNLNKPTTKEIFDATSNRPVAWKDIQAGRPEPAEFSSLPSNLPSGRTVGGIQSQQSVAAVPSGPRVPMWAKTQISTTPEVSPKISVRSASAADGTTPSASGASIPTLDAVTTTKLAKATQDGTLNGLTTAQKVEVVKAVKAGDNEAVSSILDTHAGVRNMKADVANKVAVLARYAQDHGIDLEHVSAADRQAIADAAVQHAKGIDGLIGPRSGKYQGISDSTLSLIKDSLAKR